MTSETPPTTRPTLCETCQKPTESPLCCASCGALNAHRVGEVDYFAQFGLEQSYDVDESVLHDKYLVLSRTTHPDLAGQSSQDNRHKALSVNAELNRAYETLKDPIQRAAYLLSLKGGPSAAEEKSVPGDLLGQVMLIREEIEEAQDSGDESTLKMLRQQVETKYKAGEERIREMAGKLDSADEEGKRAMREELNAIKYWSNLLDQLPEPEAD